MAAEIRLVSVNQSLEGILCETQRDVPQCSITYLHSKEACHHGCKTVYLINSVKRYFQSVVLIVETKRLVEISHNPMTRLNS